MQLARLLRGSAQLRTPAQTQAAAVSQYEYGTLHAVASMFTLQKAQLEISLR